MRVIPRNWLRSSAALMVLLVATSAMAQERAGVTSDETTESSVATEEARYLFALAQALRHEADYKGAREAFERAVAAEPSEPYLRLSFAEFLYQLGELDAASQQASAARGLGPENPEALRLLARIELRQADKSPEALENAIRLFEELRQLLPEDVESRVNSGRLLINLGRFDEAVSALREAYELRPGDLRLASILMTAYQRSENRAEAEKGLRELLARYPEFLDARLTLANLLAEQQRHADSVAVLEGGADAQRDSLEVLRLLALELYRVGAWQKSLEASERWLEVAPGEPPAVYLNALALSALARFVEAEAGLRVLYEADERSFDVARVLAEVVERQGRAAQAAEILSRAAESLEADGQADQALRTRLELVDLEVRAGNWERVLEITDRLSASAALPSEGDLKLVRGQALLEMGRTEEAIDLFEKLGSDAEVGHRARAREAEALFRAGRTEAAEKKLMRLSETGDIQQVVLAARTLHRLELYEKAIPLWLDAKNEDPEALDVRFWLGSAYERSGRRDTAIQEFRDLLARDELFAPALNYLGYMWAERGENLTEAVDLVKKAVALEPNNGAYIDSLGWVYYQMGDYELARGHLEKAARLVGEDAVVFEHLGDLYATLGRRTLAAESYQKALALADDNEEAVRRKLEQLNGDS
ncbi:MAG: tetratricopeptide repeat protein [bacterium]|nr:tetratricopeptide repeat protein [bacterium]